MAKCRIGHFVEAQVLETLGVDYIDESEVLTPADESITSTSGTSPCRSCVARAISGEALRRIAEGAAMIRTKGEPGTGNVVEAVRHMRTMTDGIAWVAGLRREQLFDAAKKLGAPYELVLWVHENGKLPVVNFSAGGIATPSDAAIMMQLGCDGVFVGSGIFKSGDPASAHAPSSRRPRTTRMPGSSQRSRATLASQWSASTSRTFPTRSGCRSGAGSVQIGVLALQGAFREHIITLESLGVGLTAVRLPSQLAGLNGLIIPGGESTAIAKLMATYGFYEPIRQHHEAGLAMWGTCAGAILIARKVLDAVPGPTEPRMMDITVRRNAFGRQVDSFEADLDFAHMVNPFTGVFIRAPWIESAGTGVEIARAHDGRAVAARKAI
jgi:pyridoxal 5'-phosphate synthase glutaminase subunit Pdx2